MENSQIYTAIIAFTGGALMTFALQRIISSIRKKKDGKKIFYYLKTQIPSKYNWLSSRHIASHTNLSISRIEEVCSNHPEIRLSTGEKEGMWGLRGVSK
jgi:hypothetical protein